MLRGKREEEILFPRFEMCHASKKGPLGVSMSVVFAEVLSTKGRV